MTDAESKKPEQDQEPDRGDSEQNGQTTEESPPVTWLEKAATLISALLVAGLIGVLIYDATRTHSPPSFTVTTGKPEVVNNSYRVPVHVFNSGDEAARAVIVHVELVGRDSVLSETDLSIDWLAGHETHKAVGYFKRPGVPHRFHAEVRGYTEP